MEKILTRTEWEMDIRGYIEQEREHRHASMVSCITETLTLKLGWEPGEAQKAGAAALLHDIGKNFIPQEILNKPGRLTHEEYAVVKTHAELGYEYLMSQVDKAPSLGWEPDVICLAAILAGQHHERVDGSGYAGMFGDEIHPLAKIMAVADVCDALYSQRPYKEPWSSMRVKANLLEGRGTLFESEYVDLLFNCFDEILGLYKVA